MSKAFAISKSRREEFTLLLDVLPEQVDVFVRSLEEENFNIFDRLSFIERLERVFDLPTARALYGQVLGLLAYASQDEISIDEVLSKVTEGLKADTKWYEENSSKWTTTSQLLKSLMTHQAFDLSAKALKLSSAFDIMMEDGYIITDTRPLLNSSRNEIIGSTIFNTLHLDYEDGAASKSISLVLDIKNLKKLQKEIEKALQKTEVIKKHLSANIKRNICILGE